MGKLTVVYKKRKSQLFPVAFLLATVFVVVGIILPQWTDIEQAQRLVDETEKSVQAKKENLRILNSIDGQVIDEVFSIVTTALPGQKDIILIFNQLEQVSERSNVGLGGFSLKVGGVYSKNSAIQDDSPKIDGVPFLNITVNASGNEGSLRAFADDLYASLPLTEINSVDLTENDGRYDVNFYYLPTISSSEADPNAIAIPLTELEMKDLDELRSWF